MAERTDVLAGRMNAQKARVTLDSGPPAEKASLSARLKAAGDTQFDRDDRYEVRSEVTR
jgi:hypothetical protein